MSPTILSHPDGQPIEFFHGARPAQNFETRDFRIPEHDGAYFSSNREYAEGFTTISFEDSHTRGWLHVVHLQVRNPIEFHEETDWERMNQRGFDKQRLIAAGHDSIIMRLKNPGESDEVLVTIFESGCILPVSIEKHPPSSSTIV